MIDQILLHSLCTLILTFIMDMLHQNQYHTLDLNGLKIKQYLLITNIDFEYIEIRYTLLGVVEYPKYLQMSVTRYTIFPQKKVVNTVSKLMCTSQNKSKYTVHIRLLKQALKYIFISNKVHKVTQFKHSHWLKPYVELNTKFRADSKNDFGERLVHTNKHYNIWKTYSIQEKTKRYATCY